MRSSFPLVIFALLYLVLSDSEDSPATSLTQFRDLTFFNNLVNFVGDAVADSNFPVQSIQKQDSVQPPGLNDGPEYSQSQSRGYSQNPNNGQNLGYIRAPGNSPASEYVQNPGYGLRPAYAQNPGLSQGPGYGQNPNYGQVPGYVHSPGYGQVPGYSQSPGSSQPPGYIQPPGYTPSPGYNPSPDYVQAPGYTPNSGYTPNPSYTPNSGHGQSTGNELNPGYGQNIDYGPNPVSSPKQIQPSYPGDIPARTGNGATAGSIYNTRLGYGEDKHENSNELEFEESANSSPRTMVEATGVKVEVNKERKIAYDTEFSLSLKWRPAHTAKSIKKMFLFFPKIFEEKAFNLWEALRGGSYKTTKAMKNAAIRYTSSPGKQIDTAKPVSPQEMSVSPVSPSNAGPISESSLPQKSPGIERNGTISDAPFVSVEPNDPIEKNKQKSSNSVSNKSDGTSRAEQNKANSDHSDDGSDDENDSEGSDSGSEWTNDEEWDGENNGGLLEKNLFFLMFSSNDPDGKKPGDFATDANTEPSRNPELEIASIGGLEISHHKKRRIKRPEYVLVDSEILVNNICPHMINDFRSSPQQWGKQKPVSVRVSNSSLGIMKDTPRFFPGEHYASTGSFISRSLVTLIVGLLLSLIPF